MAKFIKRLMLFLSPLIIMGLIMVALFFYFDPFKVIYKYTSYYQSGKPMYVSLNHEYVATETFVNNYPQQHYDSYIFGSSRAGFYETNTWIKYINSKNCYHFDASCETLYGIATKFEFLNKRNVKIKNALIIIDYSVLAVTINTKDDGYFFVKHPLLTGDSKIEYYLEYFKTFSHYQFLPSYIDFKITGKVSDFSKGVLSTVPADYDSITNETKFSGIEEQIKKDARGYYSAKKDVFYQRPTIGIYSSQLVKNKQIEMLKTIYSILKRNNTSYKIIISPLYDQLKLSPVDLHAIQSIFGSNNVFDYSGINKFTNDKTNYYEQTHYRPFVAAEIMKEVYTAK